MPLLSTFTPFGSLMFSYRPSRAHAIYDAMIRNLGGAFDTTPGTHVEASVYARARSIARARNAVDRANNQYDGAKAIEMLPGLERDYGIVPKETDTLLTRQQNVAAAQILSRGGATYQGLYNALLALLGSSFLALRAPASGDVHLSSSPSPVGNFTNPALPIQQLVFPDPIAPGSNVVARYQNADPTQAPVSLQAGAGLIVDPGNSGRIEAITIGSVGVGTITATFANGHDVGTLASTQNFANWWSTQRTLLVIVAADGTATDPTKVGQINRFMDRACRGVTQWAIAIGNTTGPHQVGTTGPFVIGGSGLGTTTLGSISYGP